MGEEKPFHEQSRDARKERAAQLSGAPDARTLEARKERSAQIGAKSEPAAPAPATEPPPAP